MRPWRGKNVEKACEKAEKAKKARRLASQRAAGRELDRWLDAAAGMKAKTSPQVFMVHDSVVVDYSDLKGEDLSLEKLQKDLEEMLTRDRTPIPRLDYDHLAYASNHIPSVGHWGQHLPRRPGKSGTLAR